MWRNNCMGVWVGTIRTFPQHRSTCAKYCVMLAQRIHIHLRTIIRYIRVRLALGHSDQFQCVLCPVCIRCFIMWTLMCVCVCRSRLDVAAHLSIFGFVEYHIYRRNRREIFGRVRWRLDLRTGSSCDVCCVHELWSEHMPKPFFRWHFEFLMPMKRTITK